MSASITEAAVANLTIDWFRWLGYDCATGAEVSPDGMKTLEYRLLELFPPFFRPTLPFRECPDPLPYAKSHRNVLKSQNDTVAELLKWYDESAANNGGTRADMIFWNFC